MAKNEPLNNLVVVSDTHSGCGLALCPPGGVKLDDGGTYRPSRVQRKLWDWWEAFWNEFVPEATRGEPFALLHNGDAIDGVHHGSTTQITANLKDQRRIAEAILAPVIAKAERYYHIRGTEAHVGKSAVEEEELARDLGAAPDEDGRHARYELWFDLAGRWLVHALHHVGTTGSQAYEATGIHKELVETFSESARWNNRPPDCIVRSHRHRYIKTEIPTAKGHAMAFVTPCWQLKTPFAWKIPGGRLSLPQIGGCVVRHAHGELFVRPWVKSLSRSRTER